MYSLGIDIGTTTITTLVVKDYKLIEAKTNKNEFILTNELFAYIQDAKKIVEIVNDQVEYFFNKYEGIKTIGITGQMHGILYVSLKNEILSPLYTWCDQRASEKMNNNTTYLDYIKDTTKESPSTGYGLTSHFYNLQNGLTPKEEYKILTIHDYIAQILSHNMNFITHSSDAASLGFYDLEENRFKVDKLKLIGIDEKNLPNVCVNKTCLGEYKGAKVYNAIGDNQASFLGATRGEDALLFNVGTGSQVSIRSNRIIKTNTCEVRPYINNDYLVVGASLCGGKSFEAIAKLFSEISGKPIDEVYSDLVNIEYRDTDLKFNTLFLGTRKDGSIRGSIENISLDNFKKEDLVLSLLNGMTDELYSFYEEMKDISFDKLIASGNGIRLNKLLKKIVENKFKKELIINEIKEEAAYGASIYSL